MNTLIEQILAAIYMSVNTKALLDLVGVNIRALLLDILPLAWPQVGGAVA